MKKLSLAKSKDDIDEIYTMPVLHSFTPPKIKVDVEIPKDYQGITIMCSQEEMDKIKEIIEWNVCADGAISDQTKNLLRKIFREGQM